MTLIGYNPVFHNNLLISLLFTDLLIKNSARHLPYESYYTQLVSKGQ